MRKRNKIALIGAGQIGGTLALLCGLRNLGDVVLFDIIDGTAKGKALDLSHLSPVFGLDFNVQGTGEIKDIKDADVCIITSGVPRKPGMSRDDLVKTNADVIRSVAKGIKEYAPNSFVVVITNPLDAMAYLMQKETGFPPERVVGMAGVLDTARYQAFLAEAIGVSVDCVNAFVLGGHGDDMVPVRSYTTIQGIPVTEFLSSDKLDEIEKRVRGAGAEVVNLLKTGSAFYSPAASAIDMVESYLFNQRKIRPCAVLCNGEYGVKGIYLGVPVMLSGRGVEKIIEIPLSPAEKDALAASAGRVEELINIL